MYLLVQKRKGTHLHFRLGKSLRDKVISPRLFLDCTPASPSALRPSLRKPKKECCINWGHIDNQRRLSLPRHLINHAIAPAWVLLAHTPPPFYRRAMRDRPVHDVVCCAHGDASVEGAGYGSKYIAARLRFVVQPVTVLYKRLRGLDDGRAIAAGAVTR